MKIDFYEINEALQKTAAYREIKQKDCLYVVTPIGPLLLIFNSPEVKGLVKEVDFKFTPSTTSSTLESPAKLLLDIEISGRNPLKVAFHWGSGFPRILLKATYLVFLAIKKTEKSDCCFPDDLLKFAKFGCLDIDLTIMRKNLEQVILPTELMVQLLDPIKAVVH